MLQVVTDATATDLQAAERRANDQPVDRRLGRLIACDGTRAVIMTQTDPNSTSHEFWSVGRLISVNTGSSRIVGFVYDTASASRSWTEGESNVITVNVELVGEVVDQPDGVPRFQRGIASYPPLGSLAHRIRARDLAAVYDLGRRGGTEVGRLSQDEAIAAKISVDDMLAQHFAIVGATGVGKSCAASMLVRAAVQARPNLRVLLLDPHNEYAQAFHGHAHVIDASTFDFPHWMLTFDEIAEVVFRGRVIEDELDALREMVITAKQRFRAPPPPSPSAAALGMSSQVGSVLRRPLEGSAASGGSSSPSHGSMTADVPVPYRMSDLIKIIDEESGRLEPRWNRSILKSLSAKIESLVNDSRYSFMFGRVVDDTMEQVISQIFRVSHQGKPITVFQLAGLPADVVNVVVSVLGRMAFDLALWGRGAIEVLLLCEEAHRYVPADERLGFHPTRRALSRIAKEGRKYGAYVGVISQRPGEIDPSVLSQCSTIFAMRLSNDRDQDIVRKAIAENSARMVTLLSSIGDREAIAFGQAVATPMRMKFARQGPAELPRSVTHRQVERPPEDVMSELRMMIARMRGGARGLA